MRIRVGPRNGFDQPQVAQATGRAADALGVADAPAGLFDLAVRIGAPTALKDIGMPHDGLDRAAKLATENPYYNPRPVDYEGVRRLLEDAYEGRRPGSS